MAPPSILPLSNTALLLLTVWGVESLFVQVTVVPTVTRSVSGIKTRPDIFTLACPLTGVCVDVGEVVGLPQPANIRADNNIMAMPNIINPFIYIPPFAACFLKEFLQQPFYSGRINTLSDQRTFRQGGKLILESNSFFAVNYADGYSLSPFLRLFKSGCFIAGIMI